MNFQNMLNERSQGTNKYILYDSIFYHFQTSRKGKSNLNWQKTTTRVVRFGIWWMTIKGAEGLLGRWWKLFYIFIVAVTAHFTYLSKLTKLCILNEFHINYTSIQLILKLHLPVVHEKLNRLNATLIHGSILWRKHVGYFKWVMA